MFVYGVWQNHRHRIHMLVVFGQNAAPKRVINSQIFQQPQIKPFSERSVDNGHGGARWEHLGSLNRLKLQKRNTCEQKLRYLWLKLSIITKASKWKAFFFVLFVFTGGGGFFISVCRDFQPKLRKWSCHCLICTIFAPFLSFSFSWIHRSTKCCWILCCRKAFHGKQGGNGNGEKKCSKVFLGHTAENSGWGKGEKGLREKKVAFFSLSDQWISSLIRHNSCSCSDELSQAQRGSGLSNVRSHRDGKQTDEVAWLYTVS